MVKHEITYHDNHEIKSSREYHGDKLVVREEFDDQGNLLYKESKDTLCIIDRLPNGNISVFLENKVKDTWERNLYDKDDNKLLSERSNGTWHESRYDEDGNKTFFLNCYGSVHYHDGRGNIKYEDFDEPELICSYELNFKKTPNKFGGLEI
jgi:hypothetical protein